MARAMPEADESGVALRYVALPPDGAGRVNMRLKRNVGLLLAAGETVVFFDDDDWRSVDSVEAPPVLGVGGSFLAGWVISSMALEPLASTAQATILCYADRPRGLEGADPILYRRFCRLAPSRPPRWVEPTENPMSPRRRSLSDTDYREVAL